MSWVLFSICIFYVILIVYLVILMIKGKLDQFKIISQGASWVIIPIVLAIIGFFIQNAIKERETQIKYVEIVLSILKENPTIENVEKRTWAVKILKKYSPVEISKNLENELIHDRPLISGSLSAVLPPIKAELKGTISPPTFSNETKEKQEKK